MTNEDTTQNITGSGYLLAGAFGHEIDKNPFRAYAKMAAAGKIDGGLTSSNLEDISDRALTLWYIPVMSKLDRLGLAGIPLTKDGAMCGTPIYADTTNTAINNHINRKIEL